jgi:Tol biopolymer transport system component
MPEALVMRADGTRARRLTHGGGCYSNPAWSPDGRRLAFEREGASGPSVWRISLGVVTISIFAERDTARRAAKALRPLSKGARARTQKPVVVFDTGVSC